MPIVNPYEALDTIPGTRILIESFGLVGSRFKDPVEPARQWTIIGALRGLFGRPDRGIRARVIDQLGFVSFVSQRDLELLLRRAKPGEFCPWDQGQYPEIGNEKEGWQGLCMDEEDSDDDLHIRELELRAQYGWGVLPEVQLRRRVHSQGRDTERLDIMLNDFDPETGTTPDPRIDNIRYLWRKVEEVHVPWTE